MSTLRGPFWRFGGVFVAGAGLAIGGVQLVERLTEVSPREKSAVSRAQSREDLDLEELRGALSSLGVETKSAESLRVSGASEDASPAREEEASEEPFHADVVAGVSAAEILAELEREYRLGLEKVESLAQEERVKESERAQQASAQLALRESERENESPTARREEPVEVRVASAAPVSAPVVELPRIPEPATGATAVPVALAAAPAEVNVHQGDVNNTTVNHTEVTNVRVINTYSPIFFLPQQGAPSQKSPAQSQNRLPSGPTYLSPWSGIDYSQHYMNPWTSVTGR